MELRTRRSREKYKCVKGIVVEKEWWDRKRSIETIERNGITNITRE